MAPGPAVRSNQPGQVEPPTQANRPLQARRLRRGLSTQPPDEPAQEPAQDPVPEAALGFEGVASGESDPQAPQTQAQPSLEHFESLMDTDGAAALSASTTRPPFCWPPRRCHLLRRRLLGRLPDRPVPQQARAWSLWPSR